MRLFVALTPPAEAIGELRLAVDAVCGRYPELRWTDSTGWHLTLVFLGEVGDDVREVLEPRLARVASRHPAPSLRLAGGGRFGDRVLWVGIDREGVGGRGPGRGVPVERRLSALAAGARRAAEKSGIAVDDRPWHGHLTLARVPRKSEPEARAAAVALRRAAAELAEFTGGRWTAGRLHLVRSVISGGPPRYEDIASWPLRGA